MVSCFFFSFLILKQWPILPDGPPLASCVDALAVPTNTHLRLEPPGGREGERDAIVGCKRQQAEF